MSDVVYARGTMRGPLAVKNRVKEFRNRRGLTLEQLAELTGLSPGQISKIENNKRGWSRESLESLADALGVKVSELIDASDAWQRVPVFGVVNDGGVVHPSDKGKGKNGLRFRAPMAFGDLLALSVPTDSLYPRYMRGTAIFCTKDHVDPSECIGRECLVQLDHGVSMIRIVHPGSAKNKFNLTTHNAAPMFNQSIIVCRPVVYSGHAEK